VTWQQQVERARSDDHWVVLEGVHALKHAIRFGASIDAVFSPDPDRLLALLADLAPDVTVPAPVQAVSAADWDAVTRGGLPSPSLALAARPVTDLAGIVANSGTAPVVFLDRPTHLGNVGAAIRVAAAAGADAVVVRGHSDPWHPMAVRGAAGLQFSLPVGRIDGLPLTDRALVAVHPDGTSIGETDIPVGALLAFGTERSGLADDVLDRADQVVRIPMRTGVSSLNLATAVAVVLYHGVVG
jgi:RNA methyltransferase, TrmH family